MFRRKLGHLRSDISHCFQLVSSASCDLAGEYFSFLLRLRQFPFCLPLSESHLCCAAVQVSTLVAFGFGFLFIFSMRSAYAPSSYPHEAGFCIGDRHVKQPNKSLQPIPIPNRDSHNSSSRAHIKI
jgi:hypothetical protein